MGTEAIVNFRRIDGRVITGGQPTEDQLRAAAAEGIQVVINLATLDPRYSLPDEAGLARELGLEYHHLPVEWEGPLPGDFAAFVSLMQASGDRPVLIHCAANYRVTAFYGLYAMQHLGWSEAQADALRAPIWGTKPYPAWEAFIRDMKAQIASARPAGPAGYGGRAL
jgi:uncharacterized protein (TIGR01244 family)